MAEPQIFDGTDGDDYYRGGNNNDTIRGGAGDDDLAGRAGDDLVDGGEGNDLIEGGNGADVLIGGDGIDAVSYAGVKGEVHIDLALGYARKFPEGKDDALSGFEVVIGSYYDDSIIGDAANNDLRGGAGYDYISAGAGDDVLRGDAGDDVLDGGAGFDMVDYFYADGPAMVDLASPLSRAVGVGTDDLRNIEGAIGTRHDDVLLGNGLANRFVGEAGRDRIDGRGGDDDLTGGAGRDRLIGGAGTDVLWGGTGADLFVFKRGDIPTTLAGADVIGDFSQAERDRIDLRRFDADLTDPGNDAFSFIGAAAFSGTAGELRAVARQGQTVIEGDTNGDGMADGVIVLMGEHVLTAADFAL